jgi:hypothetical protein
MVHMSVIEARLSQLELRVSALFKPEIRELQKILIEGEEIISVVPGRYFGGFALLCATDRRLILIDKKVAILTTEIIPYDMISEVDFGARMLDSTVVIFTVNKQHRFTTFKHRHKLRDLTSYIQQRVMELRYGSTGGTASAVSSGQPAQIAKAVEVEPAPLAEHLAAYTMPSKGSSTKPAGHLRQLVGAAALHGTPWSHVNPYTRTSFMMRSQASGIPGTPLRDLS